MINIYVASAFSKNNKGGNKAGVVLFHDELTNDQKKYIASKVGYAETAFITKSNFADFNITYFTPKEEVDLCGHATIATFTILQYLHLLNDSHYTIETKQGILHITLVKDNIFMQQNNPKFYDIIDKKELINCFDIDCIDDTYPIQIVSTGLKDILIPIKNKNILHSLKPNLKNICDVSIKYNVIGTHLFTLHENNIICRNFAPLYDVNEESATGTANCALASYLFNSNIIESNTYIFEQGHTLQQESQIIVNIKNNKHNITHIDVGGKGYFCELIHLNLF